MSPLIGHSQHPPRRRGANEGAQAGRRNARRCDCAKGGVCCQLMVHAARTHLLWTRRAAAERGAAQAQAADICHTC
jgi:hypothetical protein